MILKGKREALNVVYKLLDVVNTIFGLRVDTGTKREGLDVDIFNK